MKDDAWRKEEEFWTADAAHCREALDQRCVMAFPNPAGILAGADVVRSLEQAPAPADSGVTAVRRRQPAGPPAVPH